MTTPYTLGAFIGGMEYGNAPMEAIAALVGEMPPIMLNYIDGEQPALPNTGSASYEEGEFAGNAPWSNRSVIPMVGCPMGSGGDSTAQNLAYLEAIPKGQYDSQISGFLQSYTNAGYMTQIWRPGVEMNLTSTPGFDAYSNNPGLWIAAFQHIYTVMHAAAKAQGVNLKVVWNPGCCAGTPIGNATKTLYPGDAYCDVIGGDFYGDTQWVSGSLTQAELIANPTLLAQFYTNPAMSDPSQPTVDSSNGVRLSVADLAAFARERGKPFAMCEVGAGGTPPNDNPVFWEWLRETLDAHVAAGGTVDHVALWDSDDPEPYSFTAHQPNACAAIAANFGVNAPPIPSSAPAVAPVTPQAPVTPATPAHAASAAGTVLTGTSGTIYDTAGNAWQIAGNTQITLNGAPVTSSWEVVTLFWDGTHLYQLNSSGNWYQQPLANQSAVPMNGPPAGYTAPNAPTPPVVTPPVVTPPVVTPPHAASAVGTQLPAPPIADGKGNTWSLPSIGGQIFRNGQPVTTSLNVVAIVWIGTGLVQLNKAGEWWTQPLDGTAGTRTTAPTSYVAV